MNNLSLIELLTELKKECIHRAKSGVVLAADYRSGFFAHRTKESARFAALEAMKRVEKDRVRAFRIEAEIEQLKKDYLSWDRYDLTLAKVTIDNIKSQIQQFEASV